jgi:hypothetical protein
MTSAIQVRSRALRCGGWIGSLRVTCRPEPTEQAPGDDQRHKAEDYAKPADKRLLELE